MKKLFKLIYSRTIVATKGLSPDYESIFNALHDSNIFIYLKKQKIDQK
jgi:hypothetical protein